MPSEPVVVVEKLGKTFQSRSAAKTYWALVNGVPKPLQGKIEAALVKGTNAAGEDRVRKAEPGEQDVAMHATTHYSVIERCAHKVAWVSLKPVTGRQHQLRAHMAELGVPIFNDRIYPVLELSDSDAPDYSQPLQLLAKSISFVDPVTGQSRAFASALSLRSL